MKKELAIIVLLTVLLLSACNSRDFSQSSHGGTDFQQTEVSTTMTEQEMMTPENVTEATDKLPSQPVTESSAMTGYSSDEPVKKTKEQPNPQSKETVAVAEQQKLPETTTATEPTEKTKPANPIATTPTQKEPDVEEIPEITNPHEQTAQETTRQEETVTEPELDINYWVEYAKNYAVSKGLVLSPAAVDCWDNPIGVGTHCIYLERDIQSRLNRYANDEDITDVWIWAEPTGSGRYDLYIGYA